MYNGYLAQVTKVHWWMRHYSSRTPKRHWAYANSTHVVKLDRGTLTGWKRKSIEEGGAPTAIVYKNKAGKTCYKGTAALKKTEILSLHLIS